MEVMLIGLTLFLVFFGLQLLLSRKGKGLVKAIPLVLLLLGLVYCGALYAGLLGTYSAGAISGNQLAALFLLFFLALAAVGAGLGALMARIWKGRE